MTMKMRGRGLRWMMCAGALALAGCSQSATTGEADNLDTLVIQDPNFDFSTSRTVRLQLRASDQATEVRDAEGRRMVVGGFANDATLNLRLPVGTARTVTVRSGRGAAASETTVELGQ